MTTKTNRTKMSEYHLLTVCKYTKRKEEAPSRASYFVAITKLTGSIRVREDFYS